MKNIEEIFKEIDELENKIKTEINLEKLKEIRKEITKIENPKLEEIIDIENIKEQLWQHYRFATDEERKEAFFQLVNSKCDNELLNWETKVNLIKVMEDKIKEEVKKLHKLLDETQKKLEKLEKEKKLKENKLHQIKQKIQEYSKKNKTSKKYKTFTIVIFLIFSLILAIGSATIFNQIGTTSEKILKTLENIKKSDIQINTNNQTTNSKSKYLIEQQSESPQKSKYEILVEEETQKKPKHQSQEKFEKTNKETTTFNYKYLIMSLILLAAGKVVALGYEKLRHPKWIYLLLMPLFLLSVGTLIYIFPTLQSFKISLNSVTDNYKNLLYITEKCKDSDFAAEWSDLEDDYGDNQLACLIVSDVLSTPVYKSVDEKIKLENKEKNIIIQNIKNTEIEEDKKRMYIRKIFNQYKLYKKYKDDFITLKEKIEFYKKLSFIVAMIGEILFSSMAWMMLSEKFYGENIVDSFKLDKEKIEKELAEIENQIKSNKILVGKIKDKIQELNNYLTEIKSLNLSNYYDKETLEKKKQIIKQTCLADAKFILQSVNSYIIKRLAQGDEK